MLALALFLAAAPPGTSKVDGFVAAKQWEELYLAFAAAPAKDYSGADRSKISGALAKGCLALELGDAVMAYSLGEKAAEFEPTADALLCVGRTAQKAEQKSAAQQALETGVRTFPKDARFPLELGRLALSENDGAAAVAALISVPTGSPQGKEAAELLKRARAMEAAGKSAKGELSAAERDLKRRQDAAAQRAPPPPAGPDGPGAAPATANPKDNTITVAVGAQTVITVRDVVSVAVEDDAIADIKTIGNHRLSVTGIKTGHTTLRVATASGRAWVYSVVVQ